MGFDMKVSYAFRTEDDIGSGLQKIYGLATQLGLNQFKLV